MSWVRNVFSWKSNTNEIALIKELLEAQDEKEALDSKIHQFVTCDGSLGKFTQVLNELYSVEVDDARKVQYLSRLDKAIQLTVAYREQGLLKKASLWQRISFTVAKFFGKSHLQKAKHCLDQILTQSTHKVIIDGKLLLHAAKEGNLNLVRLLLNKGVNVNEMNDSFSTPMIEAAANGHLDVVQELVKRGAAPEFIAISKDGIEGSALLAAVDKGHIEVVEYLAKLKPGLLNLYFTYTPLQVAVRNNDFPMAETLVKLGVDVNQQAKAFSSKLTALSLAIRNENNNDNFDIIQLLTEQSLLNNPTDLNVVFEYLTLAVASNNINAIVYFVDLYHDLTKNMEGEYAKAIKEVIYLSPSLEVLSCLLKSVGGELPVERDANYIYSVLMRPGFDFEVVQALVTKRAMVFSGDDKCPLRKAISLGKEDVIELLWNSIQKSIEGRPNGEEILNQIRRICVSYLSEGHVARKILDPENHWPKTFSEVYGVEFCKED